MSRTNAKLALVGAAYTLAAMGTAWAIIEFLRIALPACTAAERAMGSTL